MDRRKPIDEYVEDKPSYQELEARIAELEKQLDSEKIVSCVREGVEAGSFELSPLLRLTLDNIPDLIWVKEKGNRYVFANQAACDTLFKCNGPGDVHGKTDIFVAEKERSAGYEHTFGEQCVDSDEVVWRTGKPGRFKEFGKVRGKELILDVTKSPIVNDEGVMVGTVGCARDITRAEKTKEALKQASTIIRELSDEISGVAVQGYDQDRRVTLWNKASELLYGYSKEDVAGKKLEDLIIPEAMRDDVILAHERWLKYGEKIPSGELTLRNKDGEPVHVFSSHVLKNTSYGLEMFCIDLDLSAAKEAEQKRRELELQLQQAQKMEAVGALAGGIAHDFNNILAVILGYADIGLEKCEVEPSFTEEFREILQAGERAKNLVGQILAFSRQKEVDLVPVLPGLVIKEALKMLRSSIPSTIHIESDIDLATGYVLADPTQIHQLCMNMCTNAYQAMENKGGIITVTLTRKEYTGDPADLKSPESGAFIQLSISDDGPGMEKDVKEKIFDPYFTTKSVGEGTGMGLSIVHSIVKSMHGSITCKSSAGVGTQFDVYLPAMVEYEVESTVEQHTKDIPGGDESILFVDDEVVLGEIASVLLEPLGYRVVTHSVAIDALADFIGQPESFDLVVTDFTMPGMNGFELMQDIRKIREDVPVIICTGNDSSITEKMMQDAGVDALAAKPISGRELALLIRNVLDQRGAV